MALRLSLAIVAPVDFRRAGSSCRARDSRGARRTCISDDRGVRRSSSFALRSENSAFAQDMVGERFDGPSGRCAEIVSLRSKLARRRSDAQRATRIGEWVGAAPDGISSAGSRVDRSRRAASKSQTRNASMKANAVRFAAALALVAFAAPLPASGQYFPPALIIVPPPAQNYAAPRPAPKPPPDKPKPD